MAKAAPRELTPISVNYTSAGLSGWTDLPIGTYRVPDSEVIITGRQKGGVGAAMFGLVGVAVFHAIDRSAEKSAVKASDAILHLTLTSEAGRDLAKLLSTSEFAAHFASASVPGDAALTIDGGIVLTFVRANSALPSVILKAKLSDPRSPGSGWTTRYLCTIGGPRAMEGNDSWSADGGAALRSTVSRELEQALRAMLADVAAPAARAGARRVAMTAYYPFINGTYQLVGDLLGDDGKWVVFAPHIADVNVMSGVDIFDKADVSYRTATKADKAVTAIPHSSKML